MQSATNVEKLDYLLMEWHDWCESEGPELEAKCAVYCSQATSSRQWEDSTEASCGRLHGWKMARVAFCITQIDSGLQRAIGIEMRNRDSKARVWRNPSGETYGQAIDALLPIVNRAGLLD